MLRVFVQSCTVISGQNPTAIKVRFQLRPHYITFLLIFATDKAHTHTRTDAHMRTYRPINTIQNARLQRYLNAPLARTKSRALARRPLALADLLKVRWERAWVACLRATMYTLVTARARELGVHSKSKSNRPWGCQ
jgi:hypothetical protein